MTQDNILELAAFLIHNPTADLYTDAFPMFGIEGGAEDCSSLIRQLAPYAEICENNHWHRAKGECPQCRLATGIWEEYFGSAHAVLDGNDVTFLIIAGVWEVPFAGLVFEWDRERGKSPKKVGRKLRSAEGLEFLRWLATKRVTVWIGLHESEGDSWSIEAADSQP